LLTFWHVIAVSVDAWNAVTIHLAARRHAAPVASP